jgi:hypothetical protein
MFPKFRRANSVTQGAAWNRLIRIYITAIPLSGDAPGIIEQIMSAPPNRPV